MAVLESSWPDREGGGGGELGNSSSLATVSRIIASKGVKTETGQALDDVACPHNLIKVPLKISCSISET